MDIVFSIVRFVRNARSELGLDPVRRLPCLAISTERADLLRLQAPVITALAGADFEVQEYLEEAPAQAVHLALPGIELYMPLGGIVDLEAERRRIQQELERLRMQIESIESRLSNAQFVDRAPAAVVQKERDRVGDSRTLVSTLTERLRSLGA
jgi:valyl-tRNA synthetase